MPIYDFRCADCPAEREVRAAFDRARSLELVCVDCGGTMRKVITLAPALLVGAAHTASPSREPERPRRRSARTCADGVVTLTRPNPFTSTLPRAGGREDGHQ